MSGPRILLVDDSRDICAATSEVFTKLGYQADVAHNGAKALELASQNAYDVTLLDYKLPDTDGISLFGRLRRLQPEILGVFLTAYATIDMVEAAFDAGAQRVLPKPADFPELIAAVEHLVSRPV